MLKPHLAGERGSALVPALLVMVLLIMFAVSTLALVEGDQVNSRQDRERESSFQLAEGVLNAQIYQLSTRWPAATTGPVHPPACNGTAATANCPAPSMINQTFTGKDYGSATVWTTYVRDNGGASSNFWSDDLLASQPPYDANDDNFVWVRATAQVHGRSRTLVALVEAEQVTLSFPRAALVAGHFETSNNGNKVIIDTNGNSNQFSPGDIIVRCPIGAPGCATYDAGKGQVEPDTVRSNVAQPRAVSVEGLDQLRDRAKAEGNYYDRCAPSLAGDQPGELVFMEDATGCSYQSNSVFNSAAKPGYLVIGRGTMGTINGTADFFGVIYHANLDDQPGHLITLGGAVSVSGAIAIDGRGGLSAGSNKVNLVYDPNVFNGFRAFGTAGIVQNTFREITAGT